MSYIYQGILFNHKNDEILPFAIGWTDIEGIMLSEISQTEKDKYHYDFTHVWNIKKKQYKTKANS